jgi:branched-chain amino acid transport system permease protein
MSTVEVAKEVSGPARQPARVTPVPPLWRRIAPWALLLAGLLLGLGLQSQLYPAQERLVGTVLMFIALATAWNLIGGFAGYASFGQVGFFGLGGYITALLMYHLHWSFWLAMLASAVVACLFAALVGAPLLRLKGHYFAIATLGVAEGLREVVINLPKVTGGGGGITIPTFGAAAPTRWLGNDGFYILFLLIAVVVVAVAIFVSSSRGGYALRAIHQDEDAAAAMGINTTLAKTLAFAGSAALTGAVGSARAFQLQTIYPDRSFDVAITVLMIVMVVLGGAGTVIGPIAGAIAIAFMSEWLRTNYTDIHIFLLGGMIILAVVLLPQGFANYLRDAVKARRFSLLENVRRYRL